MSHTKEVILHTLQYGQYKELSNKNRTYKDCLRALSYSGDYFPFVPQKWMTPDLCCRAVTMDVTNLYLVPDHIRKGNFKVDINKKRDLKAYITFTRISQQQEEYITAFLSKASIQEIDEVGDFISLTYFPKDMVPLLINCKNERLQIYLYEQLGDDSL